MALPKSYMQCKHLLIDGKNAVYRAIFAGYYDDKFRTSGYDYFVVLLRFLSSYVQLFNPESVHIMWDSPRDQVWRREIYGRYKMHRSDKYKDLTIDIHAELRRQVHLSAVIFQWLNCIQYYKEYMEADDLIYSFCVLNQTHGAPTDHANDIVIISSDQDFRQITYKMDNVHIYNPLKEKKLQQIDEKPKDDVVVIKSLMGDKSDNILGYYNIGPKRSHDMAIDPDARKAFLKSPKAVSMINGNIKWVGDNLFRLNRRVVDLSWCPFLSSNCEYVESKQQTDVKYDYEMIEMIVKNNKIHGLFSDLPRYVLPFKKLKS